MMRTQVIILNGVGSVGKSSMARALQEVAARPLLHVQMDAFLDMVPPRLIGHRDGIIFEATTERGLPCVVIHSGPVMRRTMLGMRHAIAAMAAQGNSLIVDEVLIGPDAEAEYRDLLAPYDVRFVGLFAPLAVIEARERARGDRLIGLARWQYPRVHAGRVYDLEIDTAAASPQDCAGRVQAAFGL